MKHQLLKQKSFFLKILIVSFLQINLFFELNAESNTAVQIENMVEVLAEIHNQKPQKSKKALASESKKVLVSESEKDSDSITDSTTVLRIQNIVEVLSTINEKPDVTKKSDTENPIAATTLLSWNGGILPNDWPPIQTSSESFGSWPVATIQNNTPVSCAGGLNYVYVALINQAGTAWASCQFTIKDNDALTEVAQKGLYVATQVSNINTTTQTSTITVSLTDSTGNVVAQTSYNTPKGFAVTWMNVGFNMTHTTSMNIPPRGKAFVNWVSIADSQKVFYQQSTENSVSFGGITVPSSSAAPTTLTPPSAPMMFPACEWSSPGRMCNGKLEAETSLNGKISNIVNGPISCQGGLAYINWAFTDQSAQSFFTCIIDFTDRALDPQGLLPALTKQGFLICYKIYNQDKINYAQVILTDMQNNIYAETTPAALPSGCEFSAANIGFNKDDTLTALKIFKKDGRSYSQTFINGFPLDGQALQYKDQGAKTTTTNPSGGFAST